MTSPGGNVKKPLRRYMADTSSTKRPNPKPLIVVVEDEPDLATLLALHAASGGVMKRIALPVELAALARLSGQAC